MTEGETIRRPEFAIGLAQPLWITARIGGEDVAGYAIAVGWDRPQDTTVYLVSHARFPRPVWISEDTILGNAIKPFA